MAASPLKDASNQRSLARLSRISHERTLIRIGLHSINTPACRARLAKVGVAAASGVVAAVSSRRTSHTLLIPSRGMRKASDLTKVRDMDTGKAARSSSATFRAGAVARRETGRPSAIPGWLRAGTA